MKTRCLVVYYSNDGEDFIVGVYSNHQPVADIVGEISDWLDTESQSEIACADEPAESFGWCAVYEGTEVIPHIEGHEFVEIVDWYMTAFRNEVNRKLK